jgi:hypothetical protein
MPGVLYDNNNVVVGQAVMWLTPWITPTPKPLVADATALFNVAVWEAAGWVAAGATNEGFKATIETSTTSITIEEQSTPVGMTIDGKNIHFDAALAEDTMTNYQMAWGGDTIVAAAAASAIPGTQKMPLLDDIKFWTAALEMKNQYGFARRIYLKKAVITGSGDTSFRRAADKRLHPISVASVCKPSEIQIVDIVAAALP